MTLIVPKAALIATGKFSTTDAAKALCGTSSLRSLLKNALDAAAGFQDTV